MCRFNVYVSYPRQQTIAGAAIVFRRSPERSDPAPDPQADGAPDKANRVRPEERLLNDARWNTRSCARVLGLQTESVK